MKTNDHYIATPKESQDETRKILQKKQFFLQLAKIKKVGDSSDLKGILFLLVCSRKDTFLRFKKLTVFLQRLQNPLALLP